jgi:hypothetical protein
MSISDNPVRVQTGGTCTPTPVTQNRRSGTEAGQTEPATPSTAGDGDDEAAVDRWIGEGNPNCQDR